MKIDVLTLFPEMFFGVLGASMLGRAQERGILEFGLHNCWNIRSTPVPRNTKVWLYRKCS